MTLRLVGGRDVPRTLRRTAALALALAAASAASLVPAADAAASSTTGRLVVLVRPVAGDAARAAASARAVAAGAGGRAEGRAVPELGLVAVRPRAGEPLRALAARLRADPRVAVVAAERRATLRALPDDPALRVPETAPRTPSGLPVQWWIERSGFPRAWDVTRGGGARVAVVDTGAEATHPDLLGKIAHAASFGAGLATTDEDGHGTHVASLACAATGNRIGIAGAGRDCRLVIEKSDLTDTSVAAAVVDAVNQGADAVNLSFGYDGRATPSPAVVRAIDYAYGRGVVVVAAAADRAVTEQGDPANVLQPTGTGPDLRAGRGLTVTAATGAGRRASYAGFGTQISLAAYGTLDERGGRNGMLGAFPSLTTPRETGAANSGVGCGCRVLFQGDRRWAYLRGTSMAAPQVAATAALIRDLNPALGAARIIRLVKTTARRPRGARWNPELGWGILDAGRAVRTAARTDASAPVSALRAGPVRRGVVTLRLGGRDTRLPRVRASGLARIRVYRAIDGGRLVRVASTARRRVRIRVRAGRRYAFVSQAVDRAGNAEPAPSGADVARRLARVAAG